MALEALEVEVSVGFSVVYEDITVRLLLLLRSLPPQLLVGVVMVGLSLLADWLANKWEGLM